MVVEIDGAPHMIEQIQVQTPSARGGHALQDQGAQPQDQEPCREELPRNRRADRVELRAQAGSVSLSRWRRVPFHGLRQTSPSSRSTPTIFATWCSFMTENMEGVAGPGGGRRGHRHRTARHRRAADRRDRPPACAEIRRPEGPSRPRFRPGTSFRFPSTLTRERSFASTPAPASTWAGRPDRFDRH